MAYQPINLGTVDDDGTGDDLKAGGTKINANFVELYSAIVGVLKFQGVSDCSANPNYPAAIKGDAYVVSVAGKIGGASGIAVAVGDVYVASADNAGGTQASVGTSWFVIEHNLVDPLLAANNLSDVANAGTALANLGGQPLDSDLTAIAALTTAGFGRSILETANAAALRSLAGTVIGTDVQAQDTDLAAIAALTSAADKVPYATGAGTWALADFKADVRTLAAAVSMAALRTAAGLEIGTDVSAILDIQTFAVSGTYTKPAGAKAVRVILLAGGGGGGGGGKAATLAIVSGGGGGGGGGSSDRMFDAALLAGTVAVTVATGGTGGTGATVNGPGGNGTAGGDTSFGTHSKAWGGGRGAGGDIAVAAGSGAGGSERTSGGNATGATNGSASSSVTGSSAGSNATGPTGGAGGAPAVAAGTAGNNGPLSVDAGGGGTSGGGLTAANAESAGGAGIPWRVGSNATGGTAPGGNGTNAATITDWGPGFSGGGGASSESGNGGNGGTSGRAAGGAGGGASHLGNGGNGADGGAGFAVVITYR